MISSISPLGPFLDQPDPAVLPTAIVSLVELLHRPEVGEAWVEALAPWTIEPHDLGDSGRDLTSFPFVWVSPRVVFGSGDHSRVGQLIEPDRVAGLRAMAVRHGLAVVLHGDGSIACAAVATPEALLAWRRAAITPNNSPGISGSTTNGLTATSRNTLAESARALLETRGETGDGTGNGTTDVFPVVAQLAGPTRSLAADHSWCPVAIRQPLCDHLLVHLSLTTTGLVEPLATAGGALAGLLDTPQDARYGAPDMASSSATGAVAAQPPNASTDQGGLERWLSAPVTPGPFPVSRLLADVHRRRTDLRETFVDLRLLHHRIGLWKWAEAYGQDPIDGASLPAWAVRCESPLPALDIETSGSATQHQKPAQRRKPVPRTQATRVVGFLDATLGLGEAARLIVRDLERSGQRIDTYAYEHTSAPKFGWTDRVRAGQPAADIELLCLNGDQLERWHRVETQPTSPPYRIGLWFVETPALPPAMLRGFDFVNEVWVTSSFSFDAVRAAAPDRVAVKIVPLGCTFSRTINSVLQKHTVASKVPQLSRHEHRQWCGFSFDFSSRLTRKNPEGLIEAWVQATEAHLGFNSGSSPLLILKSLNGALHPGSLQQLREAISGRDDIVLIDEAWPASLHGDFVGALDVYASLHRSEGYGLVLLEAMARGVPVVATAASGNLAFMREANSWLVPATPIELTDGTGHYGTTTLFEPDTSVAAQYLIEVLQGGPTVTQRVQLAQADVASLANGSAPAEWMQRRLIELRR